VTITAARCRHTALITRVLSFLYNLVVVALALNLVMGLVG